MVLQAIRYQPAAASSVPSLEILDQLALPHRSTYFHIYNCEDAHTAIKQMRVRGAPAIAIVAALALAVEISRRKLPSEADDVRALVSERLDYLKTSRPTAVNLADAVGKLKIIVKREALDQGATGHSVAEKYVLAAEAMLVHDVEDNEAIGRHGAKWIQDHTVAGRRRSREKSGELKILTHCNTGWGLTPIFKETASANVLAELESANLFIRSLATAGYGTALGVIRALHASGVLTRTYCSETRPYNQGSRLTAYELVHDRIPATLITDSMGAALLAREGDNIAAIVVGADRVAANGDTANKIGTYSLAILARYHGVKFLVAAPRTTIDLATKSGAEIVIEERAGEEVTRIKGPSLDSQGQVRIDQDTETISTAAEGIDVWNPAFDVTPAEFIDGIVTEVGVVEKGQDGGFNFRSIFDIDVRDTG